MVAFIEVLSNSNHWRNPFDADPSAANSKVTTQGDVPISGIITTIALSALIPSPLIAFSALSDAGLGVLAVSCYVIIGVATFYLVSALQKCIEGLGWVKFKVDVARLIQEIKGCTRIAHGKRKGDSTKLYNYIKGINIMSDLFISYSRKDIAYARLLHKALNENDLETWIDWQDIPQAQNGCKKSILQLNRQTPSYSF